MSELALTEAVPLAYALVNRLAGDLGVRVLFIKGPVADQQGLRTRHVSVDVDVMVDPAQRDLLGDGLSSLGWADEDPHTSPRVLPLHSWTYRHPQWPCELDVHDRFPGFFAEPQTVFDTLWARRTEASIATRTVPTPDVAGHTLILALHALRDPDRSFHRSALDDVLGKAGSRFDESGLVDLATLAHALGAADTAAPFLSRLGAPPVGVGTTSEADLRVWNLRTMGGGRAAVSWVEELRRRPWRARPQFIWYALMLSEKELRLADPSLPEGRKAVLGARARRLRRGLGAVPSAVAQVRRARGRGAETTPSVDSSGPGPSASVVVVQELLPEYRVPFFAGLRDRLGREGVELTVVHGFARGDRARRGDQGALPWAVTTANRHLALLPGAPRAVWQPVPRDLLDRADLVVVEQANRHLLNHLLLGRYLLRGRPRLVLWGHGGNLQASGDLVARAGEAVKRRLSARPHWWLAYTAGSAERVAATGFPRDRITVVQNAVAVTPPAAPVERLPDRCVYVGSLYPDKRIDFLLEAGRRIAELRPEFRLVVIGDGEDRGLVERAASSEGWLDHRGSMFGEETAAELERSQLLLMPGLVGLAVVDSFAHECPMVTIELPFHSPEIEYLEDGVNGVCLPSGVSAEQYAAEVAALLGDAERLERLRAGCRKAASRYTVEAMVDHVADGLLEALRRSRK
ncbi:MAG TPA: glycosyltransferase family 4 protein [Nocardioides sp.]|uniref:glycosyltransferase family 4 protein n=1 Tax=Nocardioides sp. TaxID=35761 RepID=UPI002F3E7D5C